MRTLCPNLDREDALETVLEVPVPEEMFASNKHNSWQSIKSWFIRPNVESAASVFRNRCSKIQFLLRVIGAPLIPSPIKSNHTVNDHNIKDHPIESAMAKYIVNQYIAAAGGEHALNSIDSMCAIGKVKIASSEFVDGLDLDNIKTKTTKLGTKESGGFVLWQKRPDLWSLELMLSGFKISSGCDGKVAWRETPWHHSHASRGPPRPLRRSLQGLDPRLIANLFSNSVCTGEKTINDEDCFVLKLETEQSTLKARSSSNVEVIRHTILGYFSQKTGLLVQLEDSHLLRTNSDDVFWETTMESSIQDYKTIDRVNIAHAGTTKVSLFSYGENSENKNITRIEEVWSIEEVDFNVKGLSKDCFLPPAELHEEDEGYGDVMKNVGLRYKFSDNSSAIWTSKIGNRVVAVDQESLELYEKDDEMLM